MPIQQSCKLKTSLEFDAPVPTSPLSRRSRCEGIAAICVLEGER